MKNVATWIVVTLCFVLSCTLFLPSISRAQNPTALENLGASSDSMYSSTLNDTEADSLVLDDPDETSGRSAQQIFEENPHYTVRQYDHKQQVIVGSVVMLCVALAMVAMNNYNPKH